MREGEKNFIWKEMRIGIFIMKILRIYELRINR